MFALNRRKKQVIIAFITLSLILVGPSSIYSAQAVENLPSLSNEGSNQPSSMTNVKIQTSPNQSSNINLQQLPQLIEVPQTPESIEKVMKMEEDAEKFYQQHLLDKALAKWQEAYGLSLEMKYAEGEGRALTNMGRVFLDRGQFVKAKYMGENSIEVLSGVSDKKALGRAHLYLAQAYFGLDNPAWAGQQLDFAMRAFSADGGNNASDTARLMSIAAAVIMKVGKLKEALQFLQASAMYYAQAGDNTSAITSRISVVNVLLALGLFTAAQEEAEKAISVARSAPDQIGNLTAALACYANCKFSFGEYSQAKKLYLQVLANAKKLSKEQLTTANRANLYLGYGTTLAALHEYGQAKQALDQALPIFKAAGASLPEAQAANTLGIIEWRLGHNDKAKELLQTALDLHNLITPRQESFRNTVLQNLAAVESNLGFNREARAHLESASSAQKKNKETTSLGRTHLALAETMVKLAEQTEAQNLLNSAIMLSQNVGDDAALWREYTLLAKFQVAEGNTKGAHESLLSATSFLRSPQAGEFPAPEHIYFFTDRKEMAYQLMHLLVQEKLFDEALLVSEQLKEESFLANWADCNVPVRDQDSELYTDLVLQRAHLHAAESLSAPNKLTKDWQNWIGRFRTLSGQNKQLAKLIAPTPLSVTDITRVLQTSRSTIVDYVVGRDSSIVFTLSPGGKTVATILSTGKKQIIGQVNSLLAAFAHDGTDSALTDRLLHSFYTTLIPEPVKSVLPQNPEDLVVFIPDGPLDAIPFTALTDNQNKFLVASHSISLSPTISALLDSPPRYTDNPSFLFVAGNAQDSEKQNVADQLNNIAQALPSSSVTILSGADVSLKNIQEQGAGKAAIQVAGNIDLASDGLDSVLPIAANTGNTVATLADLFSTTLSCDVFVLNGVDVKKVEDQIGNPMSPLASAACAIRYAGARNGLLSIWHQSSDSQIKELSEFYKGQLSGIRPAVALRNAQLAQIRKNERPSVWASFQFFGPLY